jgi:hypothetical protein
MNNLIHRDDPIIRSRVNQIQNWLARSDFNSKQRGQAIREISRLADDLLRITPKYDGFNSEYRHLQTVKSLDRWYNELTGETSNVV